MASTIKLKNSTTAGNTPSSLETGEVAINVADGNLFYGSASAVLQNFVVDELEVKGNLTAQQYIVSSSVTYTTQSFSSGSTAFGDSADDTHVFTGNVTASGDISSSGVITAEGLVISDDATIEDVLTVKDKIQINKAGAGSDEVLFQILEDGAVKFKVDGEGDTTVNTLRVTSDGTQSVPAIAFGTDTNTGIYQPSNNKISLQADGGTAELTVDVGGVDIQGNITASGDISASSTITANSFTGNGLSIDGPSNSHVELGTYNVGFDVVGTNTFFITGSGLIISGAMADQNHHNFLKIGEIEFVDVNTNPLAGATSNTLLIHNVNEFLITSGADGGNITTAGRLFRHQGTNFEIYRDNSSVMAASENGNVTFSGQNIIFQANGETSLKATNATPGVGAYAVFAEANPNTSPQVLRSIQLNESFPYLGGAITASAVSASGDIIASNINVTDITSSGNISSSGNVYATEFHGDGSNLTGISSVPDGTISSSAQFTSTDDVEFRNITSSGDISASGNLIGNRVYLGSKSAIVETATNYLGINEDANFTNGVRINRGSLPQPIAFYGNVTASGNISASTVEAGFYSIQGNTVAQMSAGTIAFGFQNNTPINIGKSGNPTLFHGHVTASGNVSASGDITCDNITVAGDITSVGDDVTIGDNLVLNSAAGQIIFDGTHGGGNEGIIYQDSAGGNRFGLLFPGSNVVALANRASNGNVEIRANNATAGAGGESTIATFQSTGVNITTPVTASAMELNSVDVGGRIGSYRVVLTSNWFHAQTTLRYIPFGTTSEQSSFSYITITPAVANGKLISITCWPQSNGGSTVMGLHINSNATAAVTDTQTLNIGAPTTFTFSSNNTFSQNDELSFSFDPTTQPNGMAAQILLEYDY